MRHTRLATLADAAGIAEVSRCVDRGARGDGAGCLAMSELLRVAEEAGSWKLVSRVFADTLAGRRLAQALGFREVGIYEKHGRLTAPGGTWSSSSG